jgi:hypothetical protein
MKNALGRLTVPRASANSTAIDDMVIRSMWHRGAV